MATFSKSANFKTDGGPTGYTLGVTVVTTAASGGTQLTISATATLIRPLTLQPAFSDKGSRSYSVPGGRIKSVTGTLTPTGTETWKYNFNDSLTQTVWSGVNRWIPTGSSSVNVSVTAAGSGSAFLRSTTVTVPVTLFTTATVPDVIGLSNTVASNTITSAGLVPSGSSTNTSDLSLNNKVFAQDPASGTTVDNGSTVSYSFYTYVAPTTFEVSFIDNNTSHADPAPITVVSGSTFTLPSAGTRIGHTLDGWYYNETSRQPETTSPTVTAAQTWSASWSLAYYTLNYNANGGSVSPTSKVVGYGSTYGTLPTPNRTGYSFSGWFTAASGGSQVSSSTIMGAADVTIYAQWTILTPGFTDETISQSLLLNQDFSTVSDRQVSATNATSYSIQYAGIGLNPTSWLQIDSSGRLSGSTNVVGTYYFFINAVGAGGTTPTGTKTITVSYPGERTTDGLAQTSITNAKRFDGLNWQPITSMKRFDGSVWRDVSN